MRGKALTISTHDFATSDGISFVSFRFEEKKNEDLFSSSLSLFAHVKNCSKLPNLVFNVSTLYKYFYKYHFINIKTRIFLQVNK